jgi:hypothetical protein
MSYYFQNYRTRVGLREWWLILTHPYAVGVPVGRIDKKCPRTSWVAVRTWEEALEYCAHNRIRAHAERLGIRPLTIWRRRGWLRRGEWVATVPWLTK